MASIFSTPTTPAPPPPPPADDSEAREEARAAARAAAIADQKARGRGMTDVAGRRIALDKRQEKFEEDEEDEAQVVGNGAAKRLGAY